MHGWRSPRHRHPVRDRGEAGRHVGGFDGREQEGGLGGRREDGGADGVCGSVGGFKGMKGFGEGGVMGLEAMLWIYRP